MRHEFKSVNKHERRPVLGGKVNFPVALAPMVGITHVAFRLLLREYLPSEAITIWPTEMLNSRRIPGENLVTTPETMRDPQESEMVPQILGNEESAIALSVSRLEKEWGASGIDINMGCPVKKALAHNYGVALMGDPNYASDVVKMTVRNTRLPVSVKLRAGKQNDFSYLENFSKGLQQAGASWLTLHPRTPEQKRRGTADWGQIKALRERLAIPVFGNGDVQTGDDVFRMQRETSCDLVMIGRALTARPWLLWQVGERLGFNAPKGRLGERPPMSDIEEGAEYGRALRRLLQLMSCYFSEDLALRKFRFFVRTSSPWLLFGHELYARSTQAKSVLEIDEMLVNFFDQVQPMAKYTELRQ